MKYNATIPFDITTTLSQGSKSAEGQNVASSENNKVINFKGTVSVQVEADISWADMLSFRLAELKELPTTIKAVGEAVKGVAAEVAAAVVATSEARCESYKTHRQEELDSINHKLRVQGDSIEALERKAHEG